MNPNLCRVALRPRGSLEVFDLVVRFVRVNLGVLLRMAVLAVGLPFLLIAPIGLWAEGAPWVALLPLPLSPLVQAPFTLLGGRLLFRDDTTVGSTLRELVAAVPRLLGVGLVGAVATVLAAASCGVGYLPLLAVLLYVPETALLERVGVQRGLRRSLRLAGGHVGIAMAGAGARVFLTVWMALVCEGFGQAVLDTTLQLGQPFGSLWTGQITPFFLFGMLLAQPLHAIYRLLLYVDVRTRVEGWDLQVGLRAAGLARRARR
ncbi:MAG: hypothetical protein H6737_08480 [Alphaproteobacteria bacterium]|nr:hypothetical protein [Alphaproteobacteria bacterium]